MSTTSAVYNTADPFNSPTTMENDDGSLSAPIMYASVAMGMITMWAEKRSDAKQTPGGEGSEDDPVSAGAKATTGDRTAWDEQVRGIRRRANHICHCLGSIYLLELSTFAEEVSRKSLRSCATAPFEEMAARILVD